MSHSPFSRHHASLSIEDLLQQTETRQPSWLLTYLDVFVLIIMLVLTLLALSSLRPNPEQQYKNQSNSEININQSPKKTTSSSFISNTSTPAITTARQAQLPTQSRATQLDPVMLLHPTADTDQNNRKNQPKNQSIPTDNVKPSVIESQKEDKNQTITPTDSTVEKHATEENIIQKNKLLQQELQKKIDQLGLTNAIKMRVSLGYAQLEIQDKVLFQSSTSQMLSAGKSLLNKLTPLLIKSSGLIYIEGHTDNRPINTERFPSNWELGASRATSVLHFLISQNLKASRLRAVTYGDTQPIADNTTEQGREKNRRVRLVIKVSDNID